VRKMGILKRRVNGGRNENGMRVLIQPH